MPYYCNVTNQLISGQPILNSPRRHQLTLYQDCEKTLLNKEITKHVRALPVFRYLQGELNPAVTISFESHHTSSLSLISQLCPEQNSSTKKVGFGLGILMTSDRTSTRHIITDLQVKVNHSKICRQTGKTWIGLAFNVTLKSHWQHILKNGVKKYQLVQADKYTWFRELSVS